VSIYLPYQSLLVACAAMSMVSCESQSATQVIDLNNPNRAQLQCEVQIEKRLNVPDIDIDFSTARQSMQSRLKDGTYFIAGWFRLSSGRLRHYECHIKFAGSNNGNDHWKLVGLSMHAR
jgi:hypothetical protein